MTTWRSIETATMLRLKVSPSWCVARNRTIGRKTCWFSNVRDHVTPQVWKEISATVAAKAGSRCEICGGRGRQHAVECHEVWHYDDKTQTQKLVRLTALCPDCQRVKHIGLAWKQGKDKEALAHLAKVNKWHADRGRRDLCRLPSASRPKA